MGNNRKLQGQYIRVDFTTTAERKDWLLAMAAKQEISVSQLLNRLIRNRMKNQEKYSKKDTTSETPGSQTKILSKAELLANIEEKHQNDELDDEEELPF